jgi:hypothetical protein
MRKVRRAAHIGADTLSHVDAVKATCVAASKGAAIDAGSTLGSCGNELASPKAVNRRLSSPNADVTGACGTPVALFAGLSAPAT